jgi:CHAD domain-containing protein
VSAAIVARRDAARQTRRLLRRQIRKGRRRLKSDHPTDSEVHDARKDIKKARATVGLLRNSLPRRAFRREDRILRDAARPLGIARDAEMLVAAFDGLLQHYAQARRIGGRQRFRRALLRARARARRRLTSAAPGVSRSRQLLHRAGDATRRWPRGHQGWQGLTRSATRLYARGRETLAEVRREPTVERLHTWRKQAKQLRYQLELLAPVAPPAVMRMAHELRTLSDDLGDDHDLAVLRETLAAHTHDFATAAGATALMTLIERARINLQRKALLRGAHLYRPPPSRFTRLLGG